MKRALFASMVAFAGTATLTIAAPAAADGHDAAAAQQLSDVLAHERRDNDRARDQFRRPAETLAFFQVEPDMTVAEFAPGGAWYTRVLAPYVSSEGKYLAFNYDSGARDYDTRAQEARSKGWTERFSAAVGEMLGTDPVTAFEYDEVPEDVEGTVDRVLIFRSMHGLNIGNNADVVIRTARKMLKDDGMIGVVQHRAPEGASWNDYVARQRGYLPQKVVIALFEANGFELAASSEINANPKDPANWERGVWTLPPVLATGEDDAKRSEYLAIGESDRMTLLFKKAD
ncbi:MAG: hypothetical protein ABJP70_01130 [Erythrobacter sp.]